MSLFYYINLVKYNFFLLYKIIEMSYNLERMEYLPITSWRVLVCRIGITAIKTCPTSSVHGIKAVHVFWRQWLNETKLEGDTGWHHVVATQCNRRMSACSDIYIGPCRTARYHPHRTQHAYLPMMELNELDSYATLRLLTRFSHTAGNAST